MLRIVSHGHSVERYTDFIEDVMDMDEEESRLFRTYFQLLIHENLFHSYVIRMIGMVQEHRDIEDDQEHVDYYEISQYREVEYLHELEGWIPGDIEFNFDSLYHFTCSILDYLSDEADISEVWEEDVRIIEFCRDRFVVYLFLGDKIAYR